MADEHKLVTHGSIHHKVAEAVKNSGSFVEETLIESLAQAEINKRVQIAQTGLKAIGSLKAEINKLNRPDSKTFDAAGNVTEMFSEKQFKDLKQKKEQLTRLEKAFEAALNESTGEAYGELDKLSKNSGGGKSEGTTEA